jgi:hypothetical protein
MVVDVTPDIPEVFDLEKVKNLVQNGKLRKNYLSCDG